MPRASKDDYILPIVAQPSFNNQLLSEESLPRHIKHDIRLGGTKAWQG